MQRLRRYTLLKLGGSETKLPNSKTLFLPISSIFVKWFIKYFVHCNSAQFDMSQWIVITFGWDERFCWVQLLCTDELGEFIALVNSCARFFFRHLKRRSFLTRLCTLDLDIPMSLAISLIVRCVSGWSSWLCTSSSTALIFVCVRNALTSFSMRFALW